eukprot:3300218-Amphidinium_carterae.1
MHGTPSKLGHWLAKQQYPGQVQCCRCGGCSAAEKKRLAGELGLSWPPPKRTRGRPAAQPASHRICPAGKLVDLLDSAGSSSDFP